MPIPSVPNNNTDTDTTVAVDDTIKASDATPTSTMDDEAVAPVDHRMSKEQMARYPLGPDHPFTPNFSREQVDYVHLVMEAGRRDRDHSFLVSVHTDLSKARWALQEAQQKRQKPALDIQSAVVDALERVLRYFGGVSADETATEENAITDRR